MNTRTLSTSASDLVSSPSGGSCSATIVATWLNGIGLDYAVSTFESAGIVTPSSLAELDVSFFHALGITNADDRRKLFYLVQRIRMQLEKQQSNSDQQERSNKGNATVTTAATTTRSTVSSSCNSSVSSSGVVSEEIDSFLDREQLPAAAMSVDTNPLNLTSPRRKTIEQRARMQPKDRRSKTSSSATSNSASMSNASSPVAAIKSRMRRIEHSRMQYQQTPLETQSQQQPEQKRNNQHKNQRSRHLLSPSSKKPTTTEMTSMGSVTTDDYNSEELFFDSLEDLADPEHEADDDDDDDGFWDSAHEEDDNSNNRRASGFTSPKTKQPSATFTHRSSQRLLDKKVQDQQQHIVGRGENKDSGNLNNRNLMNSTSVNALSSASGSRTNVANRRSLSSSVGDGNISTIKNRRESGKTHMTADELLDSSNNTSVNDSFTSIAGLSTTSNQSSTKQHRTTITTSARRSNLPAPSVAVTSKRNSSLIAPSKSIRTGKQLSSVPANGIMPMSPLVDILPPQLVASSNDTNNDIEQSETNYNVTTRSRGRMRRSSSGSLNSHSTNTSGIHRRLSSSSQQSQSQRLERTLSLESVLALSDYEQYEDDDRPREQGKRSEKMLIGGGRVSCGGVVTAINNSKTNTSTTQSQQSLLSSSEQVRSSRSANLRHSHTTGSIYDNKNYNDSNDAENHHDNGTDSRHRRESMQKNRSRSMSRSRRSIGGGSDLSMISSSNQGMPDMNTTAMNTSMISSSSNIGTVSYQGQKEDDSFKAQIRSLHEDNVAEYDAFADGALTHDDDLTGTDDSDMRIRVVIRKRPMTKSEIASAGDVDIIHPFDYKTYGKILVYQPKTRVDLTKEIETIPFAFDNVFDEMKSNVDIYQRAVRHMIPSFFQGQWTSVFAYGQTGSGKTYTMMGCNMTGIKDGSSNPNDASNLGLYYMAALDIFHALKLPEYANDLTLGISMFEIYAGKLFDLLNERTPVKCLEDAKGKVCFPGLSEHSVANPDELIQLIEKGARNRSTGTTSRNADSSRSHAVLQLHLRKKRKKPIPTNNNQRGGVRSRGLGVTNNGGGAPVGEFSRLTFIDLAGSERGADTQSASRATRLEGAEINTSLLALKEVIRALAKNDQSALAHVPFRGSKLTQVLKESFVGKNSKCVMIACISPNIMNCEQTLNTLRYADRVKERNPDNGALNGNIAGGGGQQLQSARSPRKCASTTSAAAAYKALSQQFSSSSLFPASLATKDKNDELMEEEELILSDDDRHLPTPNRDNRTLGKNNSALPSKQQTESFSYVASEAVDDEFDDDDFIDDPYIVADKRYEHQDDKNQHYGDESRATNSSSGNSLFEPTPKPRVMQASSKASTNNQNNYLRQTSNVSMSSDTSDVLDELLATPLSVRDKNDFVDNHYDEDVDDKDYVDEEEESDDLASHRYYKKEKAAVSTSRLNGSRRFQLHDRTSVASAKDRTNDVSSSWDAIASPKNKTVTTQVLATPSSTNRNQIQQQQIQQEQNIIATELIALHKQGLSTMLRMIKDEMVLVNSADTDRELFLNDYVPQVQAVHEKQLEWIATLREHLLKYRIISNANTNSVAAQQHQQKDTLNKNNRQRQPQQRHVHQHDDDDSFEDLRD